MVAPLLAPKNDVDTVPFGSGFLVRVSGEIFLATVAHLGDAVLAPRTDWSLWVENIFFVDAAAVDTATGSYTQIEEFPLFFEGYKGKRVPRFKYFLRQERLGTIADVILLPLQDSAQIVGMYHCFDLPADRGNHEYGSEVTQLGRRSEFPALSVAKHRSHLREGPVRLMIPETQEGDSGGPVINLDGLLVGMNVGSHANFPKAAMLMSPESIEALAAAVRGIVKDWPQFETDMQATSTEF